MVRLGDIRQQKMNSVDDIETSGGELWPFSLAFYDRAGAAAALLALQDNAGLNIDLILFAIWLGLSGRGRLYPGRAKTAAHAVRPIQREVIEPLRALRRRLKAVRDDDVQRLRETIKQLEIEAERVSLSRLAGLAGAVVQSDARLCLADAEANLCFIVGSTPCSARPAAIIRRELRRFARNRSPGPEPPQPSRPIV
jgi:uncharacterized protein (TIGR02444 family)